jgi:hypothetical protein
MAVSCSVVSHADTALPADSSVSFADAGRTLLWADLLTAGAAIESLAIAGTGRELPGSGASGSGSGDVGEDMHHLSFGRKEGRELGNKNTNLEG